MPATNPSTPPTLSAALPGTQETLITSYNAWDHLLSWLRSPGGVIQQERQEIFDWYSMPQKYPATRPLDQRNVVVCLGSMYAPVCELFGNLAGRLVMVIDSGAELAPIQLKKYTSILFVGEEDEFSKAWQDKMARTLRLPWGIVSGKHAADAAFFFAKMLLASGCKPPKSLLVNALGRKLGIQNGPQPLQGFASNKRALAVLFRQEWQLLSLYAHGEVSHLLLNSWVVCGGHHAMPAAIEPAIDYCNQEGLHRHCMRVHNRGIGIVYLPELKARHLQLFSCTSLNFARRLAPVNASLFRAVVDGYCASAIMTNRNVAIREDTVQLAHMLRCYGVPAGFVTVLLNDAEAYVHKDKPYILVGDPAGKTGRLVQSWQEGKAAVKNEAGIAVYKLPRMHAKHIIGVQTAGETRTMRGSKWLSVYYKHNHRRMLELSIKEKEFQSASRLFERALQCHRVFEHLQENLAVLMQQQPRIKRACQQTAAQLSIHSEKLKRTVDAALLVAENVQQQGIWHPVLTQHEQVLRSTIEQWQRAFCSLLHEPALFACFGGLLASNMIQTAEHPATPCDYCGTVLKKYRMLQARHNQQLEKLWCDLCGLRALALPTQDGVQIAHTKKLVPGATLPVRVTFSVPPDGSGGLPVRLVVSLYNKSQEREIERQQLQTKGREALFLLKVPHTISADLHVLGIVCVRAPHVSYYRSRISVMY